MPLARSTHRNRFHILFHLTWVSLSRCHHGGVKCSSSSGMKARQLKGILRSLGQQTHPLSRSLSVLAPQQANTYYVLPDPFLNSSRLLRRPSPCFLSWLISYTDTIHGKHIPTHSVFYKQIFHTETLALYECGSPPGTMVSCESSPDKLVQRPQSRKTRLN